MDSVSRRAATRVAAQFRVDCSYERNVLISYSRDLSVDGMFVRTERPVAVGTYVKLVFAVGDLHEVAVTAKVVWSAASDDSLEPGMGLQFLDPPESLREAVLDIVGRIAVLEDLVLTH